MKTTVTVAPDVIRARVKALSSLHIFMADLDRTPLTADNDAALNQTIVFAFSRALMSVAPWVDEFKIDPINFYDNPQSLLMLEVTFSVSDDVRINWPLLRRALEEFVSMRVMADILPDGDLAKTYDIRSADALNAFSQMLSLPSTGNPLRLSRSF